MFRMCAIDSLIFLILFQSWSVLIGLILILDPESVSQCQSDQISIEGSKTKFGTRKSKFCRIELDWDQTRPGTRSPDSDDKYLKSSQL